VDITLQDCKDDILVIPNKNSPYVYVLIPYQLEIKNKEEEFEIIDFGLEQVERHKSFPSFVFFKDSTITVPGTKINCLESLDLKIYDVKHILKDGIDSLQWFPKKQLSSYYELLSLNNHRIKYGSKMYENIYKENRGKTLYFTFYFTNGEENPRHYVKFDL
jgi:hypothetical protein